MRSCEALAERVRAITWKERNSWRRSQGRLVQEYLRRSALWAGHLGAGGWPFFDVAARVDPSVRAPAAMVETARAAASEGGTYHTLHTVEWALHFAHLRDVGGIDADLPDPFAPLIRAYERGDAVLYGCSRHIEIDGLFLPRGTAERYARIRPLDDMSEAALAGIDAAD
ncbi:MULTISPECIES: hypothetical protein [unclassified Nocardiopsis]|uniref:hypothetical protein n=1 Tax=unclassified Nocardiopsis TaxID=2649073 RepID=UPI0033CC32D8